LWSPGGQTSQTISVSTAGTYSVTVTKDGCSNTGSRTITVTPKPVVNLGANTSICAGDNITLDAGNAGATYLWSPGGQTSQTISVSTAGTYSVTVTKDGCSNTGSRTITVTPKPVVNLGANTSICAGDNITLDAGNAGATYLWSPGGQTSQTISVSTAGTYSVTVTKDGCSNTGSRTITVTPKPVVNLGADAAICSGSSITLDAGDHGTGTTYSWTPGNQTTRTIDVTTAGTYTVSVTKDGCTGSGSKTIMVNTSALVVNLGTDIERCASDPPTTLDAGITGASYLWGSQPFVPTVTNRTTKTVQTLTAGKFWVTVTKDGCSATDTIIVTNKPNILPRFTYTQTGSCSPIKVSYTNTSESCNSITGYAWDFGDGSPVLSGYHPNPEHDYDQPGAYKVTLTVSTNAESKSYEETIIVTGTGIPVNLGNDTTICAGSSITLDAGNHPGATYEWAPNGETTQSITVDKEDTYIVTVTQNGCKSIDAIHVSVVPALTVNLGNDTTICAGNSVVLDAGNPGATYLWSTGETTRTISAGTAGTYNVTVSKGSCSGSGSIKIDVSTTIPVSLGNDTTICTGSSITLDAGYPGASYSWSTTATSQTIAVSDAGVYKVTVNHNGCVGEDEIEISLQTGAEPVNLGNDTTICFGNTVKLDAGNPGATYLWSTGETTQIIYPVVSGTYSVEVTRCGITEPDEINILIAGLPTPSVTQSGNELIASTADSYQWYKNNVLIPGATDKKYKPRGYGKYKVVVTSTATGCNGESPEYFFMPEGGIYIGDMRVKISPNPGNGLARLIFSKLPPKPVKVTVYDRVGRRILVTTMINTVNDINMTTYAKGEYFVECILDDKRIIIPLITQ
jgi:PKD repeat protein